MSYFELQMGIAIVVGIVGVAVVVGIVSIYYMRHKSKLSPAQNYSTDSKLFHHLEKIEKRIANFESITLERERTKEFEQI